MRKTLIKIGFWLCDHFSFINGLTHDFLNAFIDRSNKPFIANKMKKALLISAIKNDFESMNNSGNVRIAKRE